MAKIIAPLFSLAARGTLARALTFSMRTSGAQVRFQKKQPDRATIARNVQRGYFALAASWWHLLTPAERLEWRAEGNDDN